MFLDVLQDLQGLWDKIAPYMTGITIGGIVSCLFYAFFSGSIKKFINKISIGDMIEKTVDESMERIKDLSINVELQPLVAEELNKITNQVQTYLEKTNNDVIDKMNKLIECFGKLAAYFDNSIAVPQEIKDELHIAIDEAKETKETITNTDIEVKPLMVDKKQAKKLAKENKTSSNVR